MWKPRNRFTLHLSSVSRPVKIVNTVPRQNRAPTAARWLADFFNLYRGPRRCARRFIYINYRIYGLLLSGPDYIEYLSLNFLFGWCALSLLNLCDHVNPLWVDWLRFWSFEKYINCHTLHRLFQYYFCRVSSSRLFKCSMFVLPSKITPYII